ncbi:helix-turn-helix domain-containing protein [Peribacillus simplex]|uniref:helix-turn-helix domain-containing protein n=1 Tax=Peribacillus simplex TaxID=1478 RepID=UPI000970DEE6|nr:helix-turn-helix domain-containing protein [Peribacillus simplex]
MEGEIQEVKEEEPIDQLKRWIANTGELRVNKLARLIGLGNNKVHAMMVELVNEGYLKKEGRSYAINVNDENWINGGIRNDTFYDCIDNPCCNLLRNDQRNRLYV